MPDGFEADRWYWDRRTSKALYPQRVDDDTVQFITVRHIEEVHDAIQSDALVPLDDIELDRTETTLELIDSFRTPDIETGSTTDNAATGSDE